VIFDESEPKSVLFVCTMNSIRSPIAEAFMKAELKTANIGDVFVDSAGVETKDIDGFAIAVMNEVGIDLERHSAKDLVEAEFDSYDLVVTLSTRAKVAIEEQFKTASFATEHWPVPDPSDQNGKRELRLEAFRVARDDISHRIVQRFFAK
jgi:protein-tyrosine-phosphatase